MVDLGIEQRMLVNRLDTVVAMVEAGHGIGIIPRQAAEDWEAFLSLRARESCVALALLLYCPPSPA
jgi:DNA-binding transcriptional LysR family regulator